MNNKSRQFRSRAATQQTVQAAAELFVAKGGETCILYRVQGGYEARPESVGAPHGSHVIIGKVEKQKKKGAAMTQTQTPSPTPPAPGTTKAPTTPKAPSTPPAPKSDPAPKTAASASPSTAS